MMLWLRYFRNLLLAKPAAKGRFFHLAVLLWIALNGEPKSEIGSQGATGVQKLAKGGRGSRRDQCRRYSAKRQLKHREKDRCLRSDRLHRSFGLDCWGADLLTKREQPHGSFWCCHYQNHPKQDPLTFRTNGAQDGQGSSANHWETRRGYTHRRSRLQPDHAELEGPASHLAALESISTDGLDVSGRASTFSARLHLYVEDPSGTAWLLTKRLSWR